MENILAFVQQKQYNQVISQCRELEAEVTSLSPVTPSFRQLTLFTGPHRQSKFRLLLPLPSSSPHPKRTVLHPS